MRAGATLGTLDKGLDGLGSGQTAGALVLLAGQPELGSDEGRSYAAEVSGGSAAEGHGGEGVPSAGGWRPRHWQLPGTELPVMAGPAAADPDSELGLVLGL
eukprot:3489279-Rhodomonas_salina.1